MRAGQDIILVNWVGLEGTLRIADEKETELEKRFSPVFLSQVKAMEPKLLTLQEMEAAKKLQASVYQVGEGGIFAALWRLAKEAGTGLVVDLKKISVRQETIEICEYFGLNPYQLASRGTFLAVSDGGQKIADVFADKGVEACVIGNLTEGSGKIIRNGKKVSCLNRPVPDELNKIITASQ